jgi:hypothetical protein
MTLETNSSDYFLVQRECSLVLEEGCGNATMKIQLPRPDIDGALVRASVMAHHIMLRVGVLESRAEKQPMGSGDGRLMRYYAAVVSTTMFSSMLCMPLYMQCGKQESVP